MAKKTRATPKKATPKKKAVRKQSRKAVARVLRGPIRRRAGRPSAQTFPELGALKDANLMRHAKAYADEMYESEEALGRASAAKQAIRSRMGALGSSLFSGHGYEFVRTVGDEKFVARKLKRGLKPDDTTAEVADLDNGADEPMFSEDAAAD